MSHRRTLLLAAGMAGVVLLALLLASGASARGFVCESNKSRRKHCDAGERVDDARLLEQLSNAPCREGRSWGHDDRGVWVQDGCRGRFEVATSPRRRIDCNSKDGRRRRCDAGFDRGLERAVLVRQKSDAECVRGRSWGFDRDGVWVDRGCRAEFDLFGRPEFGRRDFGDRGGRDDDASGLVAGAGALAGLAAIGAIVAGSQARPDPPPAPVQPLPPAPPAAGPAPGASQETLPWLEPAPAAPSTASASTPGGFTPPAGGGAVPAAWLGTFRGVDPASGGELSLEVREDGTAELRSGAQRWEGRHLGSALELGGVRYQVRTVPGGVGLRPADGRAAEVVFSRVASP